MRTLIQPFCSQQDKGTGRFLLDADVTVQISRFLAERLGADLLLPDSRTPLDNALQRLDFDAGRMSKALRGVDLFITHNELVAARARQLTSARIVHFNHILPIGLWSWMWPQQQASWGAADLSVFLAEDLRRFAGGGFKSAVWPMVHDERCIRPRRSGGIDLLFAHRCSVTNYTHHREVLAAVAILRSRGWKGRVVFTDPTRYLELHEPHDGIEFARCASREDYWGLLSRAEFILATMTGDMHGGVAAREAVAAGCVPILADEPCYRALAPGYPLVPLHPEALADAVQRAERPPALEALRERVASESYQRAWPTVDRDIQELIRK